MNPYEILDVPTDASDEDIKKAYRTKSKAAHPDKSNGSHEKFIEVNQAYLILSSPQRRAKYDASGSTEDDIPLEVKFIRFIDSVFMPLVNSMDISKCDLIKETRTALKNAKKNFDNSIMSEEARLDLLQNVMKRVKTDKNNLIAKVLVNHIEQCKMNIYSIHEQIGFLHQCEDILNGYTYETDSESELQRINAEMQRFFIDVGPK